MNPLPPRPSLALIVATEVLLGALFVVGLAAMFLLPSMAGALSEDFPEYAHLRGTLLAIAMIFTTLGLVAVGIVALLVHRIYRGTVLTGRSILWVDTLVATIAGAVVTVAIGFVVVSNGQAGSPIIALTQTLTGLALIAVACVTLVLRSLLRNAITMHAELDKVV